MCTRRMGRDLAQGFWRARGVGSLAYARYEGGHNARGALGVGVGSRGLRVGGGGAAPTDSMWFHFILENPFFPNYVQASCTSAKPI